MEIGNSEVSDDNIDQTVNTLMDNASLTGKKSVTFEEFKFLLQGHEEQLYTCNLDGCKLTQNMCYMRLDCKRFLHTLFECLFSRQCSKPWLGQEKNKSLHCISSHCQRGADVRV